MTTTKLNIYNYSLDLLKDYFVAQGYPSYRATQVIKWLHQDFVKDFNHMTNISKKLREDLANKFITPELNCSAEHISKDGTIKWLFKRSVFTKLR